MTPVESIVAPSRTTFERYVVESRPVIVRGAASSWPALSRWSRDFFRTTSARKPLPVDVYPRGDVFDRGGALGRVPKIELSTREYLDHQLAGGEARYYAPDLELSTYFPELERDLRVPSFFEIPHRKFLFMGTDTVTALHFHAFRHALTCQVVGDKVITLYAPEDTRHLYAHPFFAPAASWSPVDFSRSDLHRYPALARAHPLEAHLAPGDAIYIPMHWWHWVRGVGFSASVLLSWRGTVRQWHFPDTAVRSAVAATVWEPVRVASTWVRRLTRRLPRTQAPTPP
jgi:lysine-specific demethylase 8